MSTTEHRGRRSTRSLERARDDEGGFAIIVSVAVAGISMILVMMMLSTGLHLQNATLRSKKWNLALQVAEAGVERAVTRLAEDDTYAGTGAAGEPAAGGEFVTEVTTPKPGWRVVTSTGWIPRADAPNALNRRLQVTFGPSASFEFAMFSYTTLEMKNTGSVEGDLFANESISLMNAMDVKGSVISATGTVLLKNGVNVMKTEDAGSGSVYSGGFHPTSLWGIKIENTAKVERDAYAKVETCANTTVNGVQAYNIVIDGTVGGEAVAAGTISGSAAGGRLPLHCVEPESLRNPRDELPVFHYDPALYEDLTEWPSVAAFNADAGQDLTGTHRVVPTVDEVLLGTDLIDFTGKQIDGAFTLVSEARFHYGNAGGSTPFYDPNGPLDVNVNIIILNTSESESYPAINIENQLDIPDPGPAVLFYAAGLIDVRNDAEADGAVYAGKLRLKNSLDFTYDPRVERILGFGPRRFERVSYVELKRVRG